jgi:C4-dicarboxylate transporter DctM subunit
VYNLIAGSFDALDRVLGGVGRSIRGAWRAAWRGPIEVLLFYLLLLLTALWLLLEDLFAALDRAVAWLEGAFLTSALLAMVLLSFFDYLYREFPDVAPSIEGGPNMAMVLLVWVGFLGASLATRRRRHLSVDATDRLLSPPAARTVKRFSALIAAGICWKLVTISWMLTAEGLEFEDTLEGLKVWDWLAGPLNAVVGLLPGAALDWGRLAPAAIVGGLLLWGSGKLLERQDTPARIGGRVLEALGAVAVGAAALLALPMFWSPTLEFGDAVEWPTIEGGDGFPLWLAQIVLPLSFVVMGLRFLGAAIRGKFEPAAIAEVDELEDRSWIPPKPEPPGTRKRSDVIVAGLFPGLLLGMAAVLYFGKGALILIAAVLLVLMGAPLFVAVGVAALASVILISGLSGLSVAGDMFEATKKQELLAIPFFVLAGNLMTSGSLADRLIGVARALMAPIPGGLGLATVFACALFAAISGSSPVTVIAIGSILFPMLVRDKYPENYSLGVLSSAGSLGIIIPPSVPMIIYAIMVSTPDRIVSPLDLFIGGVIPGLLIAAVLMVYTLYRTRPSAGDTAQITVPETPGGYLPNLLRQIRRGALALVLILLIIGGLYGVLGPIRFTVNEAAAVAVVYALVVELLIHRELKLKDLPKVVVDSGVMMGSLFLIIVLAIAFNKFLALQQIPQQAAEWLLAHVDAQWKFIVLVNLFLLALGCVMEILSAILIVAPLLAPIADQFGLHPVHFGIMFIVNLELGYLTPPMGINLFVASTVFNRPIVQVIKSALPFLLLMAFCLVLISWFPALSLALLE